MSRYGLKIKWIYNSYPIKGYVEYPKVGDYDISTLLGQKIRVQAFENETGRNYTSEGIIIKKSGSKNFTFLIFFR